MFKLNQELEFPERFANKYIQWKNKNLSFLSSFLYLENQNSWEFLVVTKALECKLVNLCKNVTVCPI